MSNVEITTEAQVIEVVSETQTILVDPSTQTVAVVSSGPPGPPGVQGIQGIQGLSGEVTDAELTAGLAATLATATGLFIPRTEVAPGGELITVWSATSNDGIESRLIYADTAIFQDGEVPPNVFLDPVLFLGHNTGGHGSPIDPTKGGIWLALEADFYTNTGYNGIGYHHQSEVHFQTIGPTGVPGHRIFTATHEWETGMTDTGMHGDWFSVSSGDGVPQLFWSGPGSALYCIRPLYINNAAMHLGLTDGTADGVLTLQRNTAGGGGVNWTDQVGQRWQMYMTGTDGLMYFRDLINGRMQQAWLPAVAGSARTIFLDSIEIRASAGQSQPVLRLLRDSDSLGLLEVSVGGGLYWNDADTALIRSTVNELTTGLLKVADATEATHALNRQTADARYQSIDMYDGYFDGESNLPRRIGTGNVGGMLSGQIVLNYFTAKKTEAITKLRFLSGTTPAAATPSLIRYGVYSVDPITRDLTLIASTVNDTGLFAIANTPYTKTLSSTWNKVSGEEYAMGVIIVTTNTVPSMTGITSPAGMLTELGEEPRVVGQKAGLTDLPSTINAATIVNRQATYHARCLL